MPGQQLPNPNARRRNKPGEWRDLPGSRMGRPPKPPREPSCVQADEMWRSLWSQGPATAWTLADHWMVLQLCELAALDPKPSVSSECRQLMDRLGLSPKGRADLRWRMPGEHGHPGDDASSSADDGSKPGPTGVVSLADRKRKGA